MEADRWERIERLFEEARAVPSDERAAFLRTHCDDRAVRAEVASLLEAREEAPGFFEAAAEQVVTPALDEFEGVGVPDGTKRAPLDLAGQNVGPYRLVEEIGVGGMSVVYRAERVRGDYEQTVAVKLLQRRFHIEAVEERFRAERQVLASLDHPNVAQLLDGGVTEGGRPYFVMEHVDGMPLTAYADEHDLGLEARLDLLGQVIEAVQAAHRQLVVHRDLKPSNVLVTETDGGPNVKLLDFGIAKLLDEALPVTRPETRTGQHLMTPAYAAPEQVAGEDVTTATDVYQLGVLAYELLAGVRPFDVTDESLMEIERILLETDPVPPSERSELFADRLGGDLDTIILKALRKEPERRYRSVEALGTDLERYRAGEPVEAHPETLGYRAKKFVSRNRTAVTAGVLVLLLGVAYAVTVTVQANRLAEQRDRAQREAQTAEQVSDFLVNLISTTDPFKTGEEGGGDVTMSTVLERGTERIDKLEGQPAVQSEVRTLIGRIYDKIGQFEEAEPILKAALAQRRQLHGGPDSTVATTLYNLGLHNQLTGDYERADSLLREALAMRRAVHGPNHPKVAAVLNRLGSMSWYNLGNYAAADSFLHESLRIRRTVFDSAHVDLAASLNDLANLYHRQAEYDTAATYYRQAIDMYRELEGDHPNLAIIVSNFAALLRDKGAFEEAEDVQREALAMHRNVTGEESIDVALGLVSLGRILIAQGRLEAAEPHLEDGMDMLPNFFDPPHPYLLRSTYHMGRLRLQQGRLGDAERLFRKARSQAEESLPPDHPVRANPLVGLGRVHLEQGRISTAEPFLREGLSLRRKAFGPDNWMVAVAEGRLGRCLVRQGKYRNAEELLKKAHEALRNKRPAGDPYLQQVQETLVTLYDDWGKPERAASYRDSLSAVSSQQS